jgi:hypothetical protein
MALTEPPAKRSWYQIRRRHNTLWYEPDVVELVTTTMFECSDASKFQRVYDHLS